MCLVGLAYKIWDGYPIVIASNRDEFFARPAARAGFWEDAPYLLAGRDRISLGTWLGVTKEGKISFVTNKRDLRDPPVSNPISRGKLVENFLRGEFSAEDYAKNLYTGRNFYEGFNLFLFDGKEARYLSNRRDGVETIGPGFHALSNSLWNTEWPKTKKIREAMIRISEKTEKGNDPSQIASELFHTLGDEEKASEESLPDTGIGVLKEMALSSVRISVPGYGTRVSTIVMISEEGVCSFWEKTYPGPFTRETEDVHYEFSIVRK
ncbi:NRDE family protein [Leptospira ilyithenensis]|uniref:NRDE family protein n=1 Tax=Leptospira ilyithenensis TaxID=2484901 RepID=A0A4R9LV27_9LEPT|nr:NRDE family protein [Leptospira ilyithenensis]TGN16789.1 NRDE family protein [Leptospira ilyithenensis]